MALVDALRSALRGDDHIYRIGGDEFAVVIDVGGSAEVATIARRLLEAARLVGHTVSVGAALRMPGETGTRDPAPRRQGPLPGQTRRPEHRPPGRLTPRRS